MLFTIARTWKRPRCPLTDEQIEKLWYIYTMEYHSTIKRNTPESVLMMWMNLEPIINSEVSKKEENKYHILMQPRFLGFPDVSAGKESICNAGDTGNMGSIPGSGISPRGGNGNPLQDSCLNKTPWTEESGGL